MGDYGWSITYYSEDSIVRIKKNERLEYKLFLNLRALRALEYKLFLNFPRFARSSTNFSYFGKNFARFARSSTNFSYFEKFSRASRAKRVLSTRFS